jgi:hypothetical protein
MTLLHKMENLLNDALESECGLRIPCRTRGEAITLRYRLNYFRKLNREQSKEIFPPGHKQHGESVYDVLTLRIPPKGAPDDSSLYIEPRLDIDNLPRIKLSPPTA